MKGPMCLYCGHWYEALTPGPDTDELAAKGERLMLKHRAHNGPIFFVAPKGVLTAGWAIGLFP